MPKFRLTDMDLDEISLVPAGDDPAAKVVIAKAAPPDVEPDEVVYFRREVAKSNRTGNRLSTMTKRKREDEMPKINKAALPADVAQYIEELEQGLTDALDLLGVDDITKDDDTEDTEEVDEESESTDGDDDGDAADPDEDEDDADQDDAEEPTVSKAAAATIAKMQADLAKTQQELAKERDYRLRSEIEKTLHPAVTGFGISKSDMVSLILNLRNKAPQEAATVEKILASAAGQVESAGIFNEIGKAAGEGTVAGSINAQAEALRKADPTLTVEQAIARVYEQNPSLYGQEV